MGEYYGWWSRKQLTRINGWAEEDVDLDALFIDLYHDEGWLRRLLEQFPDADEDADGTITAEQAVRWHAERVPLVAPNDGEENRRRNRRVEFIIEKRAGLADD